ncbi:MAG: two-component regulator propeller domain-containing protein [Ferruginibacter sp.]
MIKYNFRISMHLLLLLGLFIDPCYGQVNAPKPAPQITGTLPSFVMHPDSVADTGLVSQYIRSIFQDSKGNFWFGPVGHAAVKYDGKTLNYFSNAEFFNGNDHLSLDNNISVHAITEDKKGNIWFGTNHGAIRYDGKTFKNYTEKHGLSNTWVGRKSILTDKIGDVWVGTAAGVFKYDPAADSTGGKCFSLFHLLPAINVKDIMEDKNGNIWFASQDKGIFRYDTNLSNGQGKTIENFSEKDGLGDNYTGGMIQDDKGNFWFTMKSGICRYDGKNFTTLTTKDGIGGSEVWGIYLEKSGIIWITARGSTTRYDPSIDISNPKAFTVFTPGDGLNCCVQSMYQDRSGNMWWGAGSGLYRFDGKGFYQVKQNGPW